MVHRSAQRNVVDQAFASTRFAIGDQQLTKDGKRREPILSILQRLFKFLFRRLTSTKGSVFDPHKHNLLELWWRRVSPTELDGESIPITGHFTEALYLGLSLVYIKESVYIAGRQVSYEEQGETGLEPIGRLAERYRMLVRIVEHLAGEKQMKSPRKVMGLTGEQVDILQGVRLFDNPKPPHPQYETLRLWCLERGFTLTLHRTKPNLVEVILVPNVHV